MNPSKFFIFLLIFFSIFFINSCKKEKKEKSLHGQRTTLPNLIKGGDFTMPATDGNHFTLSESKQWVFLYFGYTNCPDACPMTLSRIAQVESLLKKENREDIIKKLQTVFITVDPKRDDLQKLKDYLSYFPVHSLGLVSDTKTIAKVAELYNVEYKFVDIGSAAGYAVDHSTSVFLIDPSAKVRYVFTHNDNAKKIASLVMTLIPKD